MTPGRAIAIALVAGCAQGKGTEDQAPRPTLPDLWQGVFVGCAVSTCHNAQAHKGGLVLATSRDIGPSDEQYQLACANLVDRPVENPNVNGEIRVIPGDAEDSFLVKKVEGRIDLVDTCAQPQDCNCPMPKDQSCSQTMPPDYIQAIRKWIDANVPGCPPQAEEGAIDASADNSGG
jgi:hypothetical protein